VTRFYFHTEDGQPLRDGVGVDLADLDAARNEAVRAFCEILRERSREFWADGAFRMIVADGDALTLFVIEVTATAAPVVAG
jgi:hypothetical protein